MTPPLPSFRARPRLKKLLVTTAFVFAAGLPLSACKTSAEKADAFYQSGIQLLQAGDPDRAIVQFRNVFQIDGSHYDARRTLAETLVKENKPRDAYSQYLRLAEQYPDDLETRIALARLAFRSGQTDEFDRHTARAMELAPDDPRVKALDLVQRYRQAVGSGDVTARGDVTNRAEALSQSLPDDPMLLGILLDRAARNNDLTQARTLIDRLMTLEPDDPLHYKQRLALLVESGDMAAVEAHLRATIAAFPQDAEAQKQLVAFYMSQKQPEKAVAYLRERAEARPDEPGPRLDLIGLIEQQQGTPAALAELDRVLAAGGDPLIFGVLKAGYDFRAGKRTEAIAQMQTLIAAGTEPSDRTRDAKVQLARMLSETGDEVGARREVEEVLAQDPAEPGALKMKAGWAIRSDDTDTAIALLRSVLDLKPDDVQALGMMADAYQRAGLPDLSRDFLAQAATASGSAPTETLRLAERLFDEGKMMPAEEALIRALKLNSDNVPMLSLLGRVYLAMPDKLRADDVIAHLRGLGAGEAKAAADQLQVARLSGDEGQQAALGYIEKLAKAEGAGPAQQFDVVRGRLATGDNAAALKAAQELAAAEPDNRSAQSMLGLTQLASGDAEAARSTWRTLIEADAKDPAPYLMLAQLEGRDGDTGAAIKVIDAGLAASPASQDLLLAKSAMLERLGDSDGAIALLDKLYAANSDSVVLANNLASMLATYQAQQPESLARAQIVARRLQGTTVPPFMDTYGWIQHLKGDSAGALPYLEGAAAGLPDDLVTQVHLGVVQAAVGKTDAARAQLQKALQLAGNTDNAPVRTARETLARLESGAPASAAATGETGTVAAPAAPSPAAN